MIDFLGLKGRTERKRNQAAAELGAEAGREIGEAISAFIIARVTPALEGALTEFRTRVSSTPALAIIQGELATFLEWLESARDEVAMERTVSLASAREMAAAIDLSDHFEAVLSSRLAQETGRIAMAAFDYAGVLAERAPLREKDQTATDRISDALLRIGREELSSEARIEFARSRT